MRRAIAKNGGITIAILPTSRVGVLPRDDINDEKILSCEELTDLHREIDLCDGVILQGGLTSANYEVETARYCISRNIPLFASCAGFNNVVRALGSDTFEILNNKRHNNMKKKFAHNILIKKNSLLYDIFREKILPVNSIHTMFAYDRDIKNACITAHSDDGFVEAIEVPTNDFCLAVKWHPEIMVDYDDRENKIFEKFIAACRNRINLNNK